jgi:hypothetical protein
MDMLYSIISKSWKWAKEPVKILMMKSSEDSKEQITPSKEIEKQKKTAK